MGGSSDSACTMQNPMNMDNPTALATIGILMFVVFLVVAVSGVMDLADVQKSNLKTRLKFASHVNVSICSASIGFHLMHMFGGLVGLDHGAINKLSFFEYLMTCPWMMLVFVILGGPRVNGANYRPAAVCLTQLVLIFGFIASLTSNLFVKIPCFLIGCMIFVILTWIVNHALLEHSEHKEGLFRGQMGQKASPYKALGKKIFATWCLFPLWWLCSPDGLSLVTDSHDVDALVKLILNCFAKGLYIVYIRVLQAKSEGKDELMPAKHSAQGSKYDTQEMQHDDLEAMTSVSSVSRQRPSFGSEDPASPCPVAFATLNNSSDYRSAISVPERSDVSQRGSSKNIPDMRLQRRRASDPGPGLSGCGTDLARDWEGYRNFLWEECRRRDELVESNSKMVPSEFRRDELGHLSKSTADSLVSRSSGQEMPPSRPESRPESEDQKAKLDKQVTIQASHYSSKASANTSPQPNQAEPSSQSFQANSPYSRGSDQRGTDFLIPVESQPSPPWTISIPMPTCGCQSRNLRSGSTLLQPNRAQMEEPWTEETIDLN